MKAVTIVGKGSGYEECCLDSSTGDIWATSTAFKPLSDVGILADKVFQLHGPELFEPWLKDIQDRLVLMSPVIGFEKATVLPAEKLIKCFGERFGGSVSWMIAYAIVEGYEEIRFRGIHLSHFSEYGNQRDSFFYCIGRAEALGIKIVTDPFSGISFPNQTYGRSSL